MGAIAAVVFLGWAFAFARAGGPEVFVVSSLVDVRPDGPTEGEARAVVEAARGEWESFQIVVRAADAPIALDLAAAPLVGPDGAKLPIRIARVGWVDLTTPSNREGGVGRFPDPLIPAKDEIDGQRRRAFPVRVAPRDVAAAWCDLFVPPGAPPGDYRGAVVVRDGTRPLATVPVLLTVHRFTLPRDSSLPVTFGFAARAAARAHVGPAATDKEVLAIERKYARLALAHRISLHGGTFDPPPFQKSGDRMAIDFATYDAEVGPFLDGTADPSGARWTAFDLRVPARLPPGDRAAYAAAMARHLAARGWLARAFAYLADEPPEGDFPTVRARAAPLARGAPTVPRLVTHTIDPRLDGATTLYCPPVNRVDDKPGQPPAPPRDRYGRLWWYQSCLSHGCDVIGGAYASGWPSYAIDDPPVGQRVLEWLTFRYRVAGELYYNTVEAYDGDPFRDPRRHGGNGDGTLFYPGRPAAIGGTTDIPLASIRLRRIRDGLEDYEYLRLYAARAGFEAASALAARVARRTFDFDHDPRTLFAVRHEIAARLDALETATR